MIRIYSIIAYLLLHNMSSSMFKIAVAEPLEPLTSLTKQLPKWDLAVSGSFETRELKLILTKFLWENPTYEIQSWDLTKKNKFSGDSKYIIFGCSDTNNSDIPDATKSYAFKWKKKSMLPLMGFKKQLLDYYKLDKKDEIEFLYPYKKCNDDPWAVKIGKRCFIAVWVKATKQEISTHNPDGFLSLGDKGVKSKISVLVDENKNIIAKKVDGKIEFRPIKS